MNAAMRCAFGCIVFIIHVQGLSFGLLVFHASCQRATNSINFKSVCCPTAITRRNAYLHGYAHRVPVVQRPGQERPQQRQEEAVIGGHLRQQQAGHHGGGHRHLEAGLPVVPDGGQQQLLQSGGVLRAVSSSGCLMLCYPSVIKCFLGKQQHTYNGS